MCALYLYYFASSTQILRVLAAPTKLVPATTSHSAPPLKSQRWRSCSGAHGGAPVPAGANIRPFHPRPTNAHQVHPSHSSLVCSNQPANGGAPVLALPFWRALTIVRPTPVPPTPHPVHLSHPSHPSHPCSNQPMHKTMCTHTAIMIQSDK